MIDSMMRAFIVAVIYLAGVMFLSPKAIAEWRQDYYTDEFGDTRYDCPYIETVLKSVDTPFQLVIRYMGTLRPAVELMIIDGTRMVTCSAAYHSSAISVKDNWGNITKIDIDPENDSDGRIYLVGDDALKFAELIDKGNCKIILRTVTYLDTYNNPGKYLFSSSSETEGILRLLRHRSNISTEYDDDEFMKYDMGDFHGTYTLKGNIDGKYDVTMNLTFNNGSVSGTYYYDKYRRKMRIDGDLAIVGNMTLIEYDGDLETGEYVGEFNGTAFRGQFRNYSNGRWLPFYLTVK